MDSRKKVILIAGILLMGAAFYISTSTAFMALVLGLLFIPPVLMTSAALVQGILTLSENLYNPEKDDMVISL